VLIEGPFLYTSGHVAATRGIVGADVDESAAADAAGEVALLMLATIRRELGDLSRLQRLVKATGFVASAPGFSRQPQVVNGFSERIVEIFGESGIGVRSAVGVLGLPLNACVEIEAVWKLRDAPVA
jgi:enamine deaminase RidA (YjgF/YER057c/UK114 family)